MRDGIPYGAWPSPFGLDLLVQGRVGLSDVRFDGAGGAITWLESRPEEQGRQALVRWTRDGGARDLGPREINVRDRVHEYGGAPYLVHGDIVVISDFATGRLHRVARDGTAVPITPETRLRYADLTLDATRDRILAVREDHTGAGEPVNTIVAIPLDGGDQQILVQGSDFFAAPTPSPDGTRLAWLRWNHPNLPWDGTELVLAEVDADGRPTGERVVAGSAGDWVSQPRWSPDGSLHFVAEPSGWMNVHRLDADGAARAVTDEEAEFAYPDWLFGFRNYAFAPDGTILALGRSHGADQLYRIAPGGRAAGAVPEPVTLPFTELSSIDVRDDEAVLIAAGPRSFNAIVVIDLRDLRWETIRSSSTAEFDPQAVSIPEPIEFPTTGDRTAHGLFYRPTNPLVRPPEGEKPPLIVTSHGGPTAQAFGGLSIPVQLFTSRGFAVLDVDYGGSTGYGREYRKRLEGQWGVVDVDDGVAGATFLAARGDVDPRRMAVRGGSASGYTTLCSLAFRDVFGAGISYFGLGDLLAFAKETHKFESRYLDRLIGPLPEAEQLYRERSPNRYTHQIRCPVLILQGRDDHVVPVTEAERIVDSLWERRIPHAYLVFDGEDHGFRKAESILAAAAAELSFLGQVFGFEPADEIEPVEVVNLDTWRRAAEPSA